MEKRRSFIKKAGTYTLGTALLMSCAPGTEKKEEKASEEAKASINAAIGLALYTVRDLLGPEQLKTTLNKIAGLGYTELESFGSTNGEYFGLSAAEFKATLDELNLKAISGHYKTGIMQPDQIGSLTNQWEVSIEAMKTVGQEYAILAYLDEGERKTLDQYKNLVDIINVAAEKCKAAGIQFCYHNHDFEFVELEGELPMYYILDNTDPDLVKVELDLYWITKAGYDIGEFFEKYSGRIPLWHTKDLNSEGAFAEVGNGTIDFKKIFSMKELAGMEHFFVEQDVSNDPMKSIKMSYDYISKNLV